MRTKHPCRLATFDYVGCNRYFLTLCTHHRRRLFVSADRVDLVLAHLHAVASAHQFTATAYCFMPDHLHLLVEGTGDDSDGRRFIVRGKQASGFHFARRFGERLWQRYGYERTLRDEDATLSVARYILENPVRAGLVARVEDYPFLGSDVYSVPEILEAVQWMRRSG